jgi:DNA end-binding protein Ku
MWKATVRLKELSVPIKLYPAVRDSHVHFHLLHAKDGVRVRQCMVSASSGELISDEELRRGYEVDTDTFVMVSRDEIDSLQPPASREIVIEHCIDLDRLRPAHYVRPYFLGPDRDESKYRLLADSLRRAGKQGIARWVMRKRQYVGTLRPFEHGLCLITLRSDDEILASLRAEPNTRTQNSKELAIARQLIAALEGELDLGAFPDEYQERVRHLVEAKARGAALPRAGTPRTAKPTGPLSSLLEASLRRVKQERRSA